MPGAILHFHPIPLVSAELLDEAWAFMDGFVLWNRQGFEEAARAYSEALIFRSSDRGEIVGLAFLREVRVVVEGRSHLLLLTALTVIDERFRGKNLLQRAGLRSFLRARFKHPTLPIYWLFMARSYKSYLLLSRNFRDYWPRAEGEWPRGAKALLDAAGSEVYGDRWDRERGVVSLSQLCPWRPGTLELNGETLQDPEVRYFVDRAPRWRDAEALGCLCPLTLDNWSSVLVRWIARSRRGRPARGAGNLPELAIDGGGAEAREAEERVSNR